MSIAAFFILWFVASVVVGVATGKFIKAGRGE